MIHGRRDSGLSRRDAEVVRMLREAPADVQEQLLGVGLQGSSAGRMGRLARAAGIMTNASDGVGQDGRQNRGHSLSEQAGLAPGASPAQVLRLGHAPVQTTCEVYPYVVDARPDHAVVAIGEGITFEGSPTGFTDVYRQLVAPDPYTGSPQFPGGTRNR